MNRIPGKQPRVRIDPEAYDHLRKQVLRRDGWRCQSCGARSNLEVTFDESEGNDKPERIHTVFLGAMVKPQEVTAAYNHYSLILFFQIEVP